MKFFPLFLNLADKKVLVVGNGPETASRVRQLLDRDADVVVVAPEKPPELQPFVEEGKVEFRRRDFLEEDLEDCWLVFCTARDETTAGRVIRAAAARRIFCHVTDGTEGCTCILPAVVRRRELQIALSSSGKSPALIRTLKRKIEAAVGEEYGLLNDLLGELRPVIKRSLPSYARRKRVYYGLIDNEILHLLRRGELRRAREALLKKLQAILNGPPVR